MNQTIQHAPAHLQGNRRQVAAAAVAGMGTLPQPYISIEGGAFTLVDAQGMKMPWQRLGMLPHVTQQGQQMQGLCLDAVVVDINEHMSKAYYVEQWSPNAQQYLPPVCWSDNGLAPSASAVSPQNPICEHCPHNKWGSKINNLGNEVKACDDLKKIAWYVPELQMNLVFLMRLKGSSHKNWRAYIEKVRKNSVGDRPADPVDVVTRIYFEPGSTGILNFDMVGFIDAATAAIEDQVWGSKSTDLLVGRLDQPRLAALPAPAPNALQHASSPGHLPPPQQTVQPAVDLHHPPVDRVAELEAELRRLKQGPLPAAQPAGFGQAAPQARPPAPTQPQPQNNAPAGRPGGFGGAAPLPHGGNGVTTATAPSPNFGGQPAQTAATPSVPQGSATAFPSDPNLPPSGRARKQRAPRSQEPQAVAQPPQQFQQPAAQPQPPIAPNTGGTPPQPQNFGIQQGDPINADLDAALNAALGS